MKLLLIILCIMSAATCTGQVPGKSDTVALRLEYIQVRVTSIKLTPPVTKVKMKTLKRPKVIYQTECACFIPYKKRDKIYIIKPTL